MEPTGPERRITRRVDVPPIGVVVRAKEFSRGRFGQVSSVDVSEPAEIVELSAAGAGVVVRKITGLTPHAPIELCHEDQVATALVRRLCAWEDGRMLYAVEFTAIDDEMRDLLFTFVDAARPGITEDIWIHAR